ncbi:MAG: response regulator [Halanaerobium sp.]
MNRDKTILIVDDSKLNIQVLSDILKEKSYRIALARSGKVALEFVEMKRPDLILLDIMMPEIDGLTGLYNRRYFENELDRLSYFRRLPLTLLIRSISGLKKHRSL